MKALAVISILVAVIAATVVATPASSKSSTVSTISFNAVGCADTGDVTFTLTTSGRTLTKTVSGGCPAHFQRTQNFPIGFYRFRATQCVNHDYYWSPWGSFYLSGVGGMFYDTSSSMIVEPNFC